MLHSGTTSTTSPERSSDLCNGGALPYLGRRFQAWLFENPQNKLPLGYIVENKHIKKIIIEKIKNNKSIILVRDSLLKEVESTDNFILSKTNNIIIKSKLLIAADGKNSFVRNIIKTPIYNKSYKQYALGINLDHLKNHQNIAYELFYKN